LDCFNQVFPKQEVDNLYIFKNILVPITANKVLKYCYDTEKNELLKLTRAEIQFYNDMGGADEGNMKQQTKHIELQESTLTGINGVYSY